MQPIDQLEHILPRLSDLVDRIGATQMNEPTPCERFSVHDVIDHMIVLGGTFAAMFGGKEPQVATAPPAYGRVPSAEFRAAMDELLAAVRSEGAMERMLSTPLGEMDGGSFARVVAFDGLVHGWDLAVATGRCYEIDDGVVAAVHEFATSALTDDLRAGDMFDAATLAPSDASPIEELAAFSGRAVEDRWRPVLGALHIDKHTLPVKIDVPGAVARQLTGFGDATGYGALAGEYFSLSAGTDIGPLLEGLDRDTCHAPHWGYMIAGRVVVSFVDGAESTCIGGEVFYWPPGHSVRVVEDAEVILFSPEHEHVAVLDHMLAKMAPA